jgi:hypothetical protein
MSSKKEHMTKAEDIIRRCCSRHRALADERIVECPTCAEDTPLSSDPMQDRVACAFCGDTFRISDAFGHDPYEVAAERKRQQSGLHFHLEHWGYN